MSVWFIHYLVKKIKKIENNSKCTKSTIKIKPTKIRPTT